MSGLPKTFEEWQRQLSPTGRANWKREYQKRIEKNQVTPYETLDQMREKLATIEAIQNELNEV